MPTPPTQPRIHLAYIDGLRAVCALWVLLYHAVGKTPLPKVLRWINWGHFAVPAFIVISGFCLMLPVTRKNGELGSALTFYQRRARRILPPYYLALFLFVLMQGVTDWRDIGLHVLLLHNLTPTTFYGINGSFWSIAVEWQIYWLFPAIVWGWGKFGAKTVVLTTLSAAYALNFALAQTSLWGLCVHYVGLFTIGAGAAWIAFHPSLQTTRLRVPWLPFATTIGAALWLLVVRYGHPPHDLKNDVALVSGGLISLYNLLVALVVACVLIAAQSQERGIRGLLSLRLLVWIGTFSYSLYLLHQPLLYSADYYIRPDHISSSAVRWGLRTVAVAAIIGVSYAFHCAAERPFMSSSQRSPQKAPDGF